VCLRRWVRRCRLNRSDETCVERARLKLNMIQVLSNVAFKFKLRHYSWGHSLR